MCRSNFSPQILDDTLLIPCMTNNVAFSLDDSLTSRKQIDPLLEQVEEIINKHIKASDVGLELTVEESSGALTISSSA